MKRLFLILATLLSLAGCEQNSYSKFSNKYKVFFLCNTMEAPFNQLNTPGWFLTVRLLPDGRLSITDCEGHKTERELSQKETNVYILGLGGLIVGKPTFNNDNMEVWAYDLGCPECDNERYRLSIDRNGNAKCAKCGGTWNLNSSGFPTDGDSRPLYRYPVKTGISSITVQN